MDERNGMIASMLGSWLAAFAIATIAGTMLWLLGGWGFLQSAFVGALVFVAIGLILGWAMSSPLPKPNEKELVTPPVPNKKPSKVSAPTAVAPTPTAAAPAPEKEAAKKEPAKKATAKKAAAKKAAAKKTTTTKVETKAADTDDARPTLMMDAPEGGAADDLKKITGVGPKLEQTLNDLGIWHYHQVAKLKKKDIAWVDQRLRFKGRIERDDWVGQAKELAKANG